MVSTRRNGSLSSSNNNNDNSNSNSSSNSSTSSSNNSSSSSNGKRPSSASAEDKPPSPKRLKVENGGAAEKSAATPGISNENCVPQPDDPVECASVNPPAVVDGGAEAANSVKTDSAVTPVAPVSSSNPEGDAPFVMEQTKSPFSPVRNHQKQSLGFEALNTPWCRLLTQHSQCWITVSRNERVIVLCRIQI